ERLTNGLVFCKVKSWLTGRRVVSIPFSDHCAPLMEGDEGLRSLLADLKPELDNGVWKYLEIRSNVKDEGIEGMAGSATFCLHQLDLRPSLDEIFHNLHESCIRRKIIRAKREDIACEEGTSEELLRKFYQLMVLTRRRHQMLPQSFGWFRNLTAFIGGAKIR